MPQIDYRSFLNKIWEAMPAEEFIGMISDKSVLGNPLLRTQHFIGGASKWEKVSDDYVIGYHQLRVPHQVYTDESLSEVKVKGHAHSHNTHFYRKVDGEWKFAGLNPNIRWCEYQFDQVFASGRDAFGDEAAAETAEIVAEAPKEPIITETPVATESVLPVEVQAAQIAAAV